MRVSTSMRFSLAQGTIQKRTQELVKAQEQIATGAKINSLGQDPVAGRKILREETSLREIESRRRIALESELNLQQTDAVLADVSDALQRVLEVSIRLGNDTFNAQDRGIAASEVTQIRERIAELANTERNGRFLFSGLGNTSFPFDADGVFSGDSKQLMVPIGPDALVAGTIVGGEPFIDSATGESVFTVLRDLESALRGDDGAGIRETVDEVRKQIDQVAGSRQEIGHTFERLENILNALSRAEITANATLQQERDTDFSKTVLDLQESELGMRSALTITARLNELNLTNFLG
ncbi:MAG: hypothetical protein KTR25_07435 [Myxococcales bacterium]|nr:hypothetical protein [Myxococcales bacterium]